MCVRIIIDGNLYDDIKGLKSVIPHLEFEEGYSNAQDEDCLCRVNIKKTAKNNGYDVIEKGICFIILARTSN